MRLSTLYMYKTSAEAMTKRMSIGSGFQQLRVGVVILFKHIQIDVLLIHIDARERLLSVVLGLKISFGSFTLNPMAGAAEGITRKIASAQEFAAAGDNAGEPGDSKNLDALRKIHPVHPRYHPQPQTPARWRSCGLSLPQHQPSG